VCVQGVTEIREQNFEGEFPIPNMKKSSYQHVSVNPLFLRYSLNKCLLMKNEEVIFIII